MDPITYFQEEQINSLFSKRNIQQITEGKALSLDENTVFHAYTSFPKSRNLSPLLPCKFILCNSLNNFNKEISEWLSSKEALKSDQLIVFFAIGEKILHHKCFWKSNNINHECIVRFIPSKSELYSRSKGLLEVETLSKQKIGIVGLGSGGSPIAIELAKAGIGNFSLLDFDRLELSNISRHVCGINDLGRYKTFAVRDAILQKNPHANIETFEIDVNLEMKLCEEALSKVDIILCASDNDRSRFFINEISLKYKIPAIFGRAITRAVGGDVLRVRPFEGPCYSCLYTQNVRPEGGDDEEISQVQQAKKLLPDYTNENEITNVIQVGLASDIAPISNFMVKLSLVELSREINSGIKSLEDDLIADFYIWANRRENVYESWNKLEYNFNKPSILRWYGAKVMRDPNCMVCGK